MSSTVTFQTVLFICWIVDPAISAIMELLLLLVGVAGIALDYKKFRYALELGLDVWFQGPLLMRKLIIKFHRLKIVFIRRLQIHQMIVPQLVCFYRIYSWKKLVFTRYITFVKFFNCFVKHHRVFLCFKYKCVAYFHTVLTNGMKWNSGLDFVSFSFFFCCSQVNGEIFLPSPPVFTQVLWFKWQWSRWVEPFHLNLMLLIAAENDKSWWLAIC